MASEATQRRLNSLETVKEDSARITRRRLEDAGIVFKSREERRVEEAAEAGEPGASSEDPKLSAKPNKNGQMQYRINGKLVSKSAFEAASA